jgi:hypothetical protein
MTMDVQLKFCDCGAEKHALTHQSMFTSDSNLGYRSLHQAHVDFAGVMQGLMRAVTPQWFISYSHVESIEANLSLLRDSHDWRLVVLVGCFDFKLTTLENHQRPYKLKEQNPY